MRGWPNAADIKALRPVKTPLKSNQRVLPRADSSCLVGPCPLPAKLKAVRRYAQNATSARDRCGPLR